LYIENNDEQNIDKTQAEIDALTFEFTDAMDNVKHHLRHETPVNEGTAAIASSSDPAISSPVIQSASHPVSHQES
jgi:phosphoribosylaminoimidazole carboxylase (NCAIR synthetase)